MDKKVIAGRIHRLKVLIGKCLNQVTEARYQKELDELELELARPAKVKKKKEAKGD